MNAQKLSIGFAVYGLVLLASAVFCFWVNSLFHAGWLAIAGLGIMTFAHFFNRKHYWGFKLLLAELFLVAGLLGWSVLTFFGAQPVFAKGDLTINGFTFFSGLFLLTVAGILVGTRFAPQMQKELR